jgi:hypothetical protein
MSGVDLVPDEFKIGHQRHRRIRYWMALILVVCCAAGVVSGAKYLVYLREDRAAQEIAADYDELQRDIENLNRERTQLNSWQNQLALIQELGQYVDYVELTSFLAQNTPRLIYLETMDFVSPDPIKSKSSSPPPLPKSAQMFMLKETASASPARDSHSSVNMFLRGRAFNYQAVADYLTILRATPYFAAVDLKRTWRPQGNSKVESESIQFEIQCRILPMQIRKGVQYAAMPQTQNF